MLVNDILNIFSNQCNYNNINKLGETQLRNIKNGIQLSDAIYYEFLYTKKDTTKEQLISSINYKNNTHFTRQAFDSKINNIPIQLYSNLLNNLCKYYNDKYSINKSKLIGIDGTYNNDKLMNVRLNLGFYDITNGIPIDIQLYNSDSKNKELEYAYNYINKNMHLFKDNIIVCDRLYFSYKFINFLITNNLKFIIRVKGNGTNLDPNTILAKSNKNRDLILNIKKNTQTIKYKNAINKTIYNTNSKKKTEKNILEIKNDCVIITNLLDKNTYNDDTIMELYRSRWDIEVFFKYIKHNFKFQYINSKLDEKFNKMYICEMIITYLIKILEKEYMIKNNIQTRINDIKISINKHNLIEGVYELLIYEILHNKLTINELNNFYRTHIKLIKNKINRSFIRTSKKPFTKWYVKGYYIHTSYIKIINAIINNTTNKLNKNLKLIAKNIISINNKKY